MNTRAYSQTHNAFRMLNFNLDMARKKCFLALESKRMDGFSVCQRLSRLEHRENYYLIFPIFHIRVKKIRRITSMSLSETLYIREYTSGN